jgi:heme exporter protein CcmD
MPSFGNYAIYIVPAYIASILVIGVAIVLSLQAHARARRMVRQLEEDTGDSGDKQP